MDSLICLDQNFSTTRRLTKEMPHIINADEDKFETVLFLPEGESRQDEGGLRTKGYFKKSVEDKPLISIVTVVYNGEKHLEQTIQSVLNQTYENVEYIIIDGGSTDRTLEIIKKYAHAIDYWVSEKDRGIYDAMNKGIRLARGEYIGFLNADDWYEIDAIDHIAEVYYKTHSVDFIYGDLSFIQENGKVVLWKGNRSNNGLNIPHPTCFVRSYLLKKNPFNTNFKIAADTELTLRLFALNIETIYIDKIIANFRDGGVSSNFWTTQKENFYILVKYIGFWGAVERFCKRSTMILINKLKKRIAR